jgi:hypothetical protein
LTSNFLIKNELKHLNLEENTAWTWQSDEVDLE